jgi:hypothetical protein
MRILIRADHSVVFVPGPYLPEPGEGETLRDLTEAEVELVGDGGTFVIEGGVLTRKPRPAPAEVPLWRIKLIASDTPHGNGTLLEAIDALVGGTQAEFVWQYGTVLVRRSKTLEALAAELGLTAEQVDQLFRKAQRLIV